MRLVVDASFQPNDCKMAWAGILRAEGRIIIEFANSAFNIVKKSWEAELQSIAKGIELVESCYKPNHLDVYNDNTRALAIMRRNQTLIKRLPFTITFNYVGKTSFDVPDLLNDYKRVDKEAWKLLKDLKQNVNS